MIEKIVLELRETRGKRFKRPEIVTFYYSESSFSFTSDPEKAMGFKTHEEAYQFIQRHRLYNFEAVTVKFTPAAKK